MSRIRLIERTASTLRALADTISDADHDSEPHASLEVAKIEAAFQQIVSHLRYLSALYPDQETQSDLAYCFRTIGRPDLMVRSLEIGLNTVDNVTKQEILASFEGVLLEQKTTLDQSIKQIENFKRG